MTSGGSTDGRCPLLVRAAIAVQHEPDAIGQEGEVRGIASCIWPCIRDCRTSRLIHTQRRVQAVPQPIAYDADGERRQEDHGARQNCNPPSR